MEKFSQRMHPGDPIRVQINLKWSTWTQDEGLWAERAPETLKLLREGVSEGYLEEHGENIVVVSVPSKETRSMVVTLRARKDGGDGADVHVVFNETWDDLADLAEDLAVSEDELQPHLEFDECGDPAFLKEKQLKVSSLEELLVAVDQFEDECLQASNLRFQEIEKFFREVV